MCLGRGRNLQVNPKLWGCGAKVLSTYPELMNGWTDGWMEHLHSVDQFNSAPCSFFPVSLELEEDTHMLAHMLSGRMPTVLAWMSMSHTVHAGYLNGRQQTISIAVGNACSSPLSYHKLPTERLDLLLVMFKSNKHTVWFRATRLGPAHSLGC